MSSQSYTLRIAIDDSKLKDLERRLQKILGVSGTGSASGNKAQTGGNLGNPNVVKNILKLSGIAIGVVGILSVIKKIAELTIGASPILQSMLKLLNVGIMFILRPIGDFLGFFLRPLIVFFIRHIALPIYRTWGPILRQLGEWLGNKFFKQQIEASQAAGKSVFEPGFGFEDALKNLEASILSYASFLDIFAPGTFEEAKKGINDLKNFNTNIIQPTLDNIAGIFQGLHNTFSNIYDAIIQPTLDNIGGIFQGLHDIFSNIYDTIIQPTLDNIGGIFQGLYDTFSNIYDTIIAPIIGGISGIFQTLYNKFLDIYDNIIKPILDGIGGIFQTLLDTLTNKITDTIDAIVKFFEDIAKKLTDLPKLIFDIFTGMLGGGGNTTNNNNSFQVDINSNGVSDLDDIKNELSTFFNELLQGKR